MAPATNSRRSFALLASGAAFGIIIAALGLVATDRGAGRSLPAGAVARVNNELIRSEDYERLLAGVADDRGEPASDEQRRQLLERLIEEELLIQRGIELGLTRRDRRLRANLTTAVLSSIVAETDDLQPSAVELQAFYDEHRDFFTQPGALRVRQVSCRVPDIAAAAGARARAEAAAARLRAGEEFATVQRELGDPEPYPLPDVLLPPAKLRDYLGPTATRVALNLAPGEVSDPARSGTGFHVLQMLERRPDAIPPLTEIEAQVAAEFRRRASDQALRDYLAGLRARAEIVVKGPPP